MARSRKLNRALELLTTDYDGLLSGIAGLLEHARVGAARAVNSILTATYWDIGRRIVEFELGGKSRADYGEQLLERLAVDLTARYGRGFSARNVWSMKAFYSGWEILQTPSAEFIARAKCPTQSGVSNQIPPTVTAESQLVSAAHQLDAPFITKLAGAFPLSWSQYVRLISVENVDARAFYEAESIRGGWSVRQLDRQISTQFYQRLALSKRKTKMLENAHVPTPADAISVDEVIRDPYLLEFLNLKDEYSETDLEDAIIRHLEWFLLELGEGFSFIARQKRIRIGDTWYRIDLLLYHRDLRCLVVIDLKIGAFTHADSGQMNLYLNYAADHLNRPGENPPVGIILCSEKDDAVVKYATGGIQTQVFASKYLKVLPNPEQLRQEILKTQRTIAVGRTTRLRWNVEEKEERPS